MDVDEAEQFVAVDGTEASPNEHRRTVHGPGIADTHLVDQVFGVGSRPFFPHELDEPIPAVERPIRPVLDESGREKVGESAVGAGERE